MSTPVWDSGPLYASLVAGHCEKCERSELTRCVHLVTAHCRLTICSTCFSQLAVDILFALEPLRTPR